MDRPILPFTLGWFWADAGRGTCGYHSLSRWKLANPERCVSVTLAIFPVGAPELLMWKYLKEKSSKCRAFRQKCQCHKKQKYSLALFCNFPPQRELELLFAVKPVSLVLLHSHFCILGCSLPSVILSVTKWTSPAHWLSLDFTCLLPPRSDKFLIKRKLQF